MAIHTITAKNIEALAGNDLPEAWRLSETLRRWITRLETRTAAWLRYRSTAAGLARLSDSELADIGIARGEISAVARAAAFPSVL